MEELFQQPPCIVVLAGHLPLSARQSQALTTWVNRGGSLLGLGGTSGLDEVFGVKGGSPLAEGWLKVRDSDHPVTRFTVQPGLGPVAAGGADPYAKYDDALIRKQWIGVLSEDQVLPLESPEDIIEVIVGTIGLTERKVDLEGYLDALDALDAQAAAASASRSAHAPSTVRMPCCRSW